MIPFRSAPSAIIVCALLLGLTSCGSAGPRRYAVSGEVKWRSKMLDRGVIVFLPEDSAVGSGGGASIKDGKYTIPVEQGLLPGRYKVSISSADPSKAPDPNAPPGIAGPTPKDRVHPKYNVETTLNAEVKAAGANTFNFDVD